MRDAERIRGEIGAAGDRAIVEENVAAARHACSSADAIAARLEDALADAAEGLAAAADTAARRRRVDPRELGRVTLALQGAATAAAKAHQTRRQALGIGDGSSSTTEPLKTDLDEVLRQMLAAGEIPKPEVSYTAGAIIEPGSEIKYTDGDEPAEK